MSSLELDPIESWARTELDRKNAAREQALRWSRELIRACANSIRAVHRRGFSSPPEKLRPAQGFKTQSFSLLAEVGGILLSGFVEGGPEKEGGGGCKLAPGYW